MNTYRVEYVSKDKMYAGGIDVEFDSIFEAAEFAQFNFGLNHEILSITKTGEIE